MAPLSAPPALAVTVTTSVTTSSPGMPVELGPMLCGVTDDIGTSVLLVGVAGSTFGFGFGLVRDGRGMEGESGEGEGEAGEDEGVSGDGEGESEEGEGTVSEAEEDALERVREVVVTLASEVGVSAFSVVAGCWKTVCSANTLTEALIDTDGDETGEGRASAPAAESSK